MHPDQLHLTASLASLKVALARLGEVQDADRDDDRGTLRAWAPSDGRGGSGGQGLDVIFRARQNGKTLELLRAESAVTLAWLWPAGIPATIDWIIPPIAKRKAQWTDELDGKVRTALRMDFDREPMPGAECPSCTRRTLHRRVASGLIACACGMWFAWSA